MSVKCPKCQIENPDDFDLCKECSTKLIIKQEMPVHTKTLRTPTRGTIKDVNVGDIIGDKYKLIEELGSGGMGVVYKAEQKEPIKRNVALKVIKLGMDTEEVVARFETEKQALAVMRHPNIAKVHDAGATKSGRPYFVMELVLGIPITDYCDKHKLTTKERLELFIPVCEAVQHAHQKGVIHRDLKPSNVLVEIQEDKTVPKIIDFGIAKATEQRLAERTIFTEQGQFIGTPEYMSPEQAEMSGLDVDTRTDIYSLGVILYELLIGVLPFDPQGLRAAGFAEMQRIIRETDPPKASTRLTDMGEAKHKIASLRKTDPSSLYRQIKRDLDWIMIKALEKDRTRRYETANGLAMDIQRNLNNEPVMARPPSAAYRMSKFARRHKVGLAAGLLVSLALISGFTLATIGLIRAKRAEAKVIVERDRANKEAETARQVSGFLEGLFRVSDPSEALGNTITAREILDKGVQKIEQDLADQPLVQARLMNVMGVVYRSLGLSKQARSLLEGALEKRRQVLGNEHLDVAESLNNLAAMLSDQGEFAETGRLLKESIAIYRNLLGDEHLYVAVLMNNLALNLQYQGKYEEAIPVFRESLSIRRKLKGDDHPDVAHSLNNFGMLHFRMKNYEEAEKLLREALRINRKHLGQDHPQIAANLNNIALVLRSMGRLKEAEPLFRQSVAMRHKLYGESHPLVAQGLKNIAYLLVAQEKYDEAEKVYNEVVDLQLNMFSEDHWEIATTKNMLGECLTKARKYEEAEPLLTSSYPIIRAQFGLNHPRAQVALRRIIYLYEDWEKPEKADEYRSLLQEKEIQK